MKKFSKILALTLVLCQISACFAACGGIGTQNDETTESITEDSAPFSLTVDSLSKFTIIYHEGEETKRTALSLASLLQDYTGIKPEVKSDASPESEYEVLVGRTNRAGTDELYADVEYYDMGYALIGKKLFIIGWHKECTASSVTAFKKNILINNSEDGILMQNGDTTIIKDRERNALHKWLEQSKQSYYASVLEGVTVNALGDSYFAGEGLPQEHVWLGLLESKYGLNMNNYGKGGSTVTNKITTNSPMCERYTQMANNNADIILLEGGRNDFNKEVAIGSVDSYDTTTFSGALNVIIEGLKKKYPDAMIVCISNWNFPGSKSGITYLSYASAMEAVAQRQGVYFIPAYDPSVSGIDMTDEGFRAQYCMKESDISHLNLNGMKIAMTHFEKLIAEYYEDFLNKKQEG